LLETGMDRISFSTEHIYNNRYNLWNLVPLIGLNATYLISAGMGLLGIPFVLMLPPK
jgi:hypothetical protein